MFLSRTMQLAEENYEIYNKELLVIVKALTKWKQYLLDSIERFEVWIDYYDFTLYHIPEKTNTKANILSRKDQVDTAEDNKNV